MTKVKICGITNLEDAVVAVDAGADALGFNFYEKSPRYISTVAARDIIAKLPPDIFKVGVFVNSSVAKIGEIIAETSIGHVQLHGDEEPDFVRRLKNLTNAKVIKAFRVAPGFEPKIAVDFEADDFMLDADSRSFGGSGETFEWDVAVKFKEFAPQLYLAGGLTPDNVGDAVRIVLPFAVDVCSGVESVRGQKDHAKVAAFVRNAKNAL